MRRIEIVAKKPSRRQHHSFDNPAIVGIATLRIMAGYAYPFSQF